MTADPYADGPGDPYDPDGRLRQARASLVDMIGEKLKGQILGVPGPDPARIEVVAAERDGLEFRVEVTVPLGTTYTGIGHLLALASGLAEGARDFFGEPVEDAEQDADQGAPVGQPA